MLSLDTPIESIPKINRKILPALKRLGIKTVRDLLFHFPSRYDDFSNQKNIADIEIGEVVTVQGQIKKISVRRTFYKHMSLAEIVIDDGTGKIKAIWFNQPYLVRTFKEGGAVWLSGKVAKGPNGIYLQNPAYEKIPTTYNLQPTSSSGIHTGGLVAIYPETRGVSSRWLRFLMKNFIALRKDLRDPLPSDIRKKYKLLEIREAVNTIHFPKTKEDADNAKRRFAYEQLFLLQLRGLRSRMNLKQQRAPEIGQNIELIKKFVSSLPFALTDAQRRSMWEIIQDISKPHPMNRLLEGDVGSGKTVVAAAASLLAVDAGYAVAFLAPTEILAHQHYATLEKALKPFAIPIGLLLGSAKKASAYDRIIVGTHALLQKNVRLERLGLVIVDEQHRFGVEQRAHLLKKQEARSKSQEGRESLILDSRFLIPHLLSMSATPIPRTLALTMFGDLDISILDEMPKARKEIITKIIEPQKRYEAYAFIREEVKRGRQAFVICPRISSDTQINADYPIPQTDTEVTSRRQSMLLAEVKTVKDEYKKLSETIFPDLRVAMLHGKLKAKEKEAVMRDFRGHQSDILVSTSVIEVGVDVPNATIMMIEGAERFGLAQLHQFRGRVGRGSEQSYCFLFSTEGGIISRRLRALTETKNGFELAKLDLEIRGPGELFGIRQSGIPEVAVAHLADAKLIHSIRTEAIELLKKDPGLTSNPELKLELDLMEKTVHLE